MNIAITGSSGFIGSRLLTKLLQNKDITPLVFDREKYSLDSVASLKHFVENQDSVIHLAGVTKNTAKIPSDFYHINTLGTANLLEAVRLFGKPQTNIVFASSFAVYEEQTTHVPLSEEKSKTIPRNQYGLSKLFAEELLMYYNRNYHIPIRILRIASPYGPGAKKGVIAQFINKIQREEPIIINDNGKQVTDFIFIDDVVDAFIKTLSSPYPSLLVNICSGHEGRVVDVLHKISQRIGKQANITYNEQQSEKGYWIGDPQKAAALLNFRATTDIDSGLQKTITKIL